MTSYTATLESAFDDMPAANAEHLIAELEGHSPVIGTNDAGHNEIIMSLTAPTLESAVRMVSILVEGLPFPRLRSMVLEPSEDFDRRVDGLSGPAAADTFEGVVDVGRRRESLEAAKAIHPAYRS